ncbi:MAG: hypothetical protein ACRCVD_01030, partial [Halioglobus sp.]
MMHNALRALLASAITGLVSGCVTATVDQMVYNKPENGIGEATVVVLGRRHASDYDTEPDFVDCVGDHLAGGEDNIRVIGELEFVNQFYPWFEPRTAPLQIADLERLLQKQPVVAERLAAMN